MRCPAIGCHICQSLCCPEAGRHPIGSFPRSVPAPCSLLAERGPAWSRALPSCPASSRSAPSGKSSSSGTGGSGNGAVREGLLAPGGRAGTAGWWGGRSPGVGAGTPGMVGREIPGMLAHRDSPDPHPGAHRCPGRAGLGPRQPQREPRARRGWPPRRTPGRARGAPPAPRPRQVPRERGMERECGENNGIWAGV